MPDHVVADLPAAADVILAGVARRGSSPDDWESHWAEYADAAGDNPAQEYRRRLIVARIGDPEPPMHLLDIGSGQGDLLASLRGRWPTAELVGLELSAEGIRRARTKLPSADFHQIDLMSAGNVPAELQEWADVAVCSEVLEHVDDPVRLLRVALQAVKPGGRLVVTVPGGPRTAFDRFIGHRRHFRPADLRSVLERGRGWRTSGSAGPGSRSSTSTSSWCSSADRAGAGHRQLRTPVPAGDGDHAGVRSGPPTRAQLLPPGMAARRHRPPTAPTGAGQRRTGLGLAFPGGRGGGRARGSRSSQMARTWKRWSSSRRTRWCAASPRTRR